MILHRSVPDNKDPVSSSRGGLDAHLWQWSVAASGSTFLKLHVFKCMLSYSAISSTAVVEQQSRGKDCLSPVNCRDAESMSDQ